MPAVDNIYVGHNEADAKEFAKTTYHVKKPLEQAAEGSSDDDDEPSGLVDKIRLRVYEFIRKLHTAFTLPNITPPSAVASLSGPVIDPLTLLDLAGLDVKQAVKTMPDVAAGLSAVAFTLIGMLLGLFGFIGSKPTVVSCPTTLPIGSSPCPCLSTPAF